jgi:hypothetical protein
MSSKKPVAEIELRLSTDEISRIVGFLGYGRPSAPVWFIGIEEGLGLADSEEAVSNLKARTSFDPVMDLRQAHLRLREKGRVIDVEQKKSFTQVWEWMGKFMRAHHGNQDWKEIGPAREYVRRSLGRFDGETFLTELSPVPEKRVKKSKTKTFMELFKECDPTLDSKIKRRMRALQQALLESDPPLVVCYGMGRGLPKKFAELLGVEWLIHPADICRSPDSRRLLLPFFGQGQMKWQIVQVLLDQNFLGHTANPA